MRNPESGTDEPTADWVGFGPDDEYDMLEKCGACEGQYGRVEECASCHGDGAVIRKGPDW